MDVIKKGEFIMEDKRFTVNNLGDGCWLFEGPSRSGKNDLGEFVNIPNLILLDVHRVDDFVMALQNRTKAIKLSDGTTKHNFIFMVKDKDIADYIRSWFYDGDFSHRMSNRKVVLGDTSGKALAKVLPKDTEISKYFEFQGSIFEELELPDGRYLVRLVHTWGDGTLMDFGFEYSDGIGRTGMNPLHVVRIYNFRPSKLYLESDLKTFLRRREEEEAQTNG